MKNRATLLERSSHLMALSLLYGALLVYVGLGIKQVSHFKSPDFKAQTMVVNQNSQQAVDYSKIFGKSEVSLNEFKPSHWSLKGIISSQKESLAVVVVKQQEKTLKAGDSIDEYSFIVSIDKNQVIIESRGQRQKVVLFKQP